MDKNADGVLDLQIVDRLNGLGWSANGLEIASTPSPGLPPVAALLAGGECSGFRGEPAIPRTGTHCGGATVA